MCLAQLIRLPNGKFRNNRIDLCIFRQFDKLAESTDKFRKEFVLLLRSHRLSVALFCGGSLRVQML